MLGHHTADTTCLLLQSPDRTMLKDLHAAFLCRPGHCRYSQHRFSPPVFGGKQSSQPGHRAVRCQCIGFFCTHHARRQAIGLRMVLIPPLTSSEFFFAVTQIGRCRIHENQHLRPCAGASVARVASIPRSEAVHADHGPCGGTSPNCGWIVRRATMPLFKNRNTVAAFAQFKGGCDAGNTTANDHNIDLGRTVAVTGNPGLGVTSANFLFNTDPSTENRYSSMHHVSGFDHSPEENAPAQND